VIFVLCLTFSEYGYTGTLHFIDKSIKQVEKVAEHR